MKWTIARYIFSLASGIVAGHYESRSIALTQISVTPFHVLMIYHTTQLLPPLARFVIGKITDDELLYVLTARETEMVLFFGPSIASRVLSPLWPFRWWIAAAYLSIGPLLALFPDRTASGEWSTVKKFVHWIRRRAAASEMRTLSLRGIFLRIYQPLLLSSYHHTIKTSRLERMRCSDKTDPYEYRPLQSPRHIRLLKLCKQGRSKEPHCELLHFDIDTAPPYDALSYTWGLQEPSIPLSVDKKRILATPAVEEFLTFQWSKLSSKLFWIDAVCIDQKNDIEKTAQIPLMTKIYQSANRVVVWLAPPDTLESCTLIRSAVMDEALSEDILYDQYPNAYRLMPELSRTRSSVHREVACFLSHPWFGRTWIIQELSVASVIHFLYKGTSFRYSEIAWLISEASSESSQIFRLQLNHWHAMQEDKAKQTLPSWGEAMSLFERMRNCAITLLSIRSTVQEGSRLDLPKVLRHTALFQCKDSRDRIFALHGLVDDETAQSIPPDYTKSAEELCRSLTHYGLQSPNWFELLRLATRTYPTRKRNPRPSSSWMVELEATLNHEALQPAREPTKGAVELRDKTATVQLTTDPNLIKVACSVIGTVRDIGPNWDYPQMHAVLNSLGDFKDVESPASATATGLSDLGDKFEVWYRETKDVARRVSGTSDEDSADQSFWEAWSSHLNHPPKGYPSEAVHPRSSAARRLFEIEGFEQKAPTKVEDSEQIRLCEQLGISQVEYVELYLFLYQEILKTFAGNRLCSASKGQLAMVPWAVESGDIIVHVRGGYMPLVLRKNPHHERRAELVAACYVHGEEDIYRGHDWEDWFLE